MEKQNTTEMIPERLKMFYLLSIRTLHTFWTERILIVKHEVVEVSVSDVYFLQKTCSNAMRNGASLMELTQQIRDGDVHPLRDDFLILDVIAASLRINRRPGAKRRAVSE